MIFGIRSETLATVKRQRAAYSCDQFYLGKKKTKYLIAVRIVFLFLGETIARATSINPIALWFKLFVVKNLAKKLGRLFGLARVIPAERIRDAANRSKCPLISSKNLEKCWFS